MCDFCLKTPHGNLKWREYYTHVKVEVVVETENVNSCKYEFAKISTDLLEK